MKTVYYTHTWTSFRILFPGKNTYAVLGGRGGEGETKKKGIKLNRLYTAVRRRPPRVQYTHARITRFSVEINCRKPKPGPRAH